MARFHFVCILQPKLQIYTTEQNHVQKASFLILICIYIGSQYGNAQNFGSSYDFLLKETNARTAALGGINNSLRDGDPSLVFGNPASANAKMAQNGSFTINPSFAKIVQYNVSYADSIGKIGNVYGGIQFLNYGNLKQTDNTGLVLGDFTASQYAITLGTSQKKGNFNLGIGVKWIGFQVASYQSNAAALDLGVHYQHPTKQFQFGMVVKNLGFRLKSLYADQKMPLPFNIQASISYKLEHMPLRVSASAFYLQETDIQYLDPNAPGTLDANGIEVKPTKKISEQIARHLCIGGEFLLHRNFNILFGYNHLRRKELRPTTGAGMTGFSLGFAVITKSLRIGYSYSGWQPELGQHFISLNLNFKNWFTKSPSQKENQPQTL